MGALTAIIEADFSTALLPIDVLLSEARRPEPGQHREDWPYIAGYACSALRSIAIGDDSNATQRACAVALLLCKRATFDAITAAAHESEPVA